MMRCAMFYPIHSDGPHIVLTSWATRLLVRQCFSGSCYGLRRNSCSYLAYTLYQRSRHSKLPASREVTHMREVTHIRNGPKK